MTDASEHHAESRPKPQPSPEDVPRYSAVDVARLRREAADWYGGQQGVQFYGNAIAFNRQNLRPWGPADECARLLAAAEATRLREADLWYIDEDLCALLNAAHGNMPRFAPLPEDLPSRFGFAVFADPIARYPNKAARVSDLEEELAVTGGPQFRQLTDHIAEQQAQIVAVSWGPTHDMWGPDRNPSWPAGGVWMSFYAASGTDAMAGLLKDNRAAAARARAMAPPLDLDNEAAMAWRPPAAPAEPYMLPGPDARETTLSWARLVFAAFQLAAQANLAERAEFPTPRQERRRGERQGLPARDVRIIRLRRGLAADRDAEEGRGREWRHRWVVRGHWRRHWYPKLEDHRPIWIAPYLKGPADAPLLGGDKVTIITAPTADQGPDVAHPE